jgi:hypothetical protein
VGREYRVPTNPALARSTVVIRISGARNHRRCCADPVAAPSWLAVNVTVIVAFSGRENCGWLDPAVIDHSRPVSWAPW